MTPAKKDAPQTRPGSSRITLTGESARNTRGAVKRLLLYARPYSAQLIIVALLVIIRTFASLAGPILFGIAIDQFIGTGDGTRSSPGPAAGEYPGFGGFRRCHLRL